MVRFYSSMHARTLLQAPLHIRQKMLKTRGKKQTIIKADLVCFSRDLRVGVNMATNMRWECSKAQESCFNKGNIFLSETNIDCKWFNVAWADTQVDGPDTYCVHFGQVSSPNSNVVDSYRGLWPKFGRSRYLMDEDYYSQNDIIGIRECKGIIIFHS